MRSIELLLEEYKLIGSIGEKYFDRMYAILNLTIVYYGAILTIMFGMERSAPAVLVFNYFLPVGTYLFGLFYAYNSFAITKQGLHMIRIERLIKHYSRAENKRKSFIGWNIMAKTKRYNGDYILAYGTSLMFFLLAPVFDYVLGFMIRNDKNKIVEEYIKAEKWDFFFNILPIIFYIIYIVFMIKIIVNIVKIHKEINQILFRKV